MHNRDEHPGMNDSREILERAARVSVKTTIVGGQPPSHERAIAEVPVGIEDLLTMAAVEPRFARELLARRSEAIEASGVRLTSSERAILGAVPSPALEQMISGMRDLVPEADRRQFMGQSAAALLVLVGAGLPAASGCNGASQRVTGARPDPPPPKREQVVPPYGAETGSRPDEPEQPAGSETAQEPPSDPLTPPSPDSGCARPRPSPSPYPAPTGARPDPPEGSPGEPEHYGSPKTGSRPDRPDAGPPSRPPKSRGISFR